MIPVVIQEYINKILDTKTHTDRRQFYYDTLIKIRESINHAITRYEQERKFKK
jgi:hypothetical protein